jgi:hypothetical protein
MQKQAYLGLDVLERGRGDKRETDEENVGLGVGKRAETIVILLSGSIPKTEVDGLSVNHDIGRVVVKASWFGSRGDGWELTLVSSTIHCHWLFLVSCFFLVFIPPWSGDILSTEHFGLGGGVSHVVLTMHLQFVLRCICVLSCPNDMATKCLKSRRFVFLIRPIVVVFPISLML